MNWVDVVALTLTAFSGMLGFLRGLVREVFGLSAWIGAFVAAWWFYDPADAMARRAIANPDVADPVAFGAVFLVTLIVLTILAGALGGAVRRSSLGGLDRTLGLVYGLARGAVILIAAYIVASAYELPDQWPNEVLEARLLPSIYSGAVWATGRMPPWLASRMPDLPVPPTGRPTSSAELLHANPVGRAGSSPPARP